MNYTRKELENLYGNRMITKAEMEILIGSESLANEIVKRVEIKKSSNDKELLEKCLSPNLEISTEAYNQYENRNANEQINMRKKFARNIEKCVAEFDAIVRKAIRKSGESKQALESRIWLENPELLEQYCDAQRKLLTPETK